MEHWTNGLVKQGLYYEGWVSDLDSVLASHSRETVTSYGTRRSTKNTAANLSEEDKENCQSEVCSIQVQLYYEAVLVLFSSQATCTPKLYWSKGTMMHLNNTPFCVLESKRLECHYGPHYYKERPQKSHRLQLQGSRKIGCNAHIMIKKCATYPQYKASATRKTGIRMVKEKLMKDLKQKLTEDPKGVESSILYYISVPTEDAHHGHPTGDGVAGFSQRMNEKVAEKLVQIVGEGIEEIKQVL